MSSFVLRWKRPRTYTDGRDALIDQLERLGSRFNDLLTTVQKELKEKDDEIDKINELSEDRLVKMKEYRDGLNKVLDENERLKSLPLIGEIPESDCTTNKPNNAKIGDLCPGFTCFNGGCLFDGVDHKIDKGICAGVCSICNKGYNLLDKIKARRDREDLARKKWPFNEFNHATFMSDKKKAKKSLVAPQ
jgi:hypothetical protein